MRCTQNCIVLLLALAFFRASSLQASVLADNLDQPTGSTETVGGGTLVASSFGTESSQAKLKSVELLLTDVDTSVPIVHLYSDNGGAPGSELGALIFQGFGPFPQLVLFDGNQINLTPMSTYWVVASAQAGHSYSWSYASTASGTGPGFRSTWGISYDAGGHWFTSNTQPMQMRIEDSSSVIPEPVSSFSTMLGILILGLLSVHREANT